MPAMRTEAGTSAVTALFTTYSIRKVFTNITGIPVKFSDYLRVKIRDLSDFFIPH